MKSSGFYDDGFDVWINYPHEIAFEGGSAFVELEVQLFCQPDESVGNTDWWVPGVEVRASKTPDSALTQIALPKNDPLHMKIVGWAIKHESDLINSRWQEWLNDRPRKRRS